MPLRAAPIEQAEPDGSRKLWIAVLLSVIRDALHGTPKTAAETRRARIAETRRARNWVMRDQRDFEAVCGLAGFDAEGVRDRLRPKLAEAPTLEELFPNRARRAQGGETECRS